MQYSVIYSIFRLQTSATPLLSTFIHYIVDTYNFIKKLKFKIQYLHNNVKIQLICGQAFTKFNENIKPESVKTTYQDTKIKTIS